MVRISKVFALIALASVSCSPAREGVADVDALTKREGQSVWSVLGEGCGWKTRGSAFAIDSRHLVTNHHVIANDSSPTLRSRDGKELAGKVIGASASPDIAVIEVSEDLPSHLQWTTSSALTRREPVVVMGYPSPTFSFSASTGRIVNFQGPGDEAALVNAPIALGNSGGPGLRGDASVAGVVTQMTIRKRSEERVAILFTADAIRPTVARFLAKPTKVLSSCGLGPDYVPPVPKSYDVEEAPRMAAPMEALPVPTEAPVAAAPRAPGNAEPTKAAATKKPAQCPTGAPDLEVRQLNSSQQEGQPDWWRVDVRGHVRNDTSSTIEIHTVEVTVDGDPPITRAAGQFSARVPAGQTTGWVFEEQYVHSPGNQPTRATAVVDWEWVDGRGNSYTSLGGVDCPSEDVKASGPNPAPT